MGRRTTAFLEVLTGALAAATLAYGLLVVAGQQWLWMTEEGRAFRTIDPAFQAIIPVAAAVTTLIGLRTRRVKLVMGSGLAILLFSALFVFGVGGGLLPIALPLVICAAMYTRAHRDPQ
jgi:hypothetical protein